MDQINKKKSIKQLTNRRLNTDSGAYSKIFQAVSRGKLSNDCFSTEGLASSNANIPIVQSEIAASIPFNLKQIGD